MRRVSILAAAILGSATLAFAQTAPAGARPEPGVQASSPYWNGQPQQQPVVDLPAAEIRAVPGARANAVRAKWTFQQSISDLSNATRLAQKEMERDPQFLQARTDESAAYDELTKARTAALAPLQANSAYSGANQLHQNLTTQIADEHSYAKPDERKVAAMAWLKTQYIRDNRRLENAVLEQDQAYQDARRKYLTVANRVASMRDAQSMAIARDSTLVGLRRQLADARIEKNASNIYWLETVEARRLALNYAYFSRDIDRRSSYGYGGGYGGYYGGYNYGGGYGFRY